MSNPESPQQPSAPADASPEPVVAIEPVAEPAAAAATEPVAATEPETEAGTDAAKADGEKKRRRRRRRKKGARTEHGAAGRAPGEPAAGEAAAAERTDSSAPAVGGQATTDGEAVAAEPLDPAAVAGPLPRDPNAAPRIEKKKRDRKHAPPRERPPVNLGDIVFGKILEITDEAILVDIPGKAKAIFDRRELLLLDDDEAPPPAAETTTDAAAETVAGTETATEAATAPEPPKEPKVPRVVLEVGADFIAMVHNDGGRGGLVVLTHHPNRADRSRGHVEKAFNDKTTILGLVTGVIKGGVEVDVDGLRAFAPGSHVDLHLGADLHPLVGKRLPFVVTTYAKRGRDLVLSRRAMLEEEARKARAAALEQLEVGEERDGIVRSVVPFGAFVDVGGIEGLVPLQEMSHNRADGPSDVFKAGEPTRVKVTKIDDKGKIWLSRKATIPDPWAQVAQKYAQGTRHAGKVARIQPFGAFVELEPGIDGLIHLADLSLKRIESPEDVVKVGDAIEVVVSHVDSSSHKIALHPALMGEEAKEAPQRIAPHKPVKAKVLTIESGGLVVRILGVTGRTARGYITAAGTGTPRGTELRKAFKLGQEVEAKVMEIDPRRGEVKLSIKALSDEQERNAYQQYRQQLKAEARFTFGDLLKKDK